MIASIIIFSISFCILMLGLFGVKIPFIHAGKKAGGINIKERQKKITKTPPLKVHADETIV